MLPPPPSSTLFPYTTLFRSQGRQLGQRGQADGGRDHVVGGLRHVDVIVGMHRLVRAALPAQQLVRAIGEHLVTVHVVRGADRKSTRLNSSHVEISYAVFCLK